MSDPGVAVGDRIRARRGIIEHFLPLIYLGVAAGAIALARADGIDEGDRWGAITVVAIVLPVGLLVSWIYYRPGAGVTVTGDGWLRLCGARTRWVDLNEIAWVQQVPELAKVSLRWAPDVMVGDRQGRHLPLTMLGPAYRAPVAHVVQRALAAGVPISASVKTLAAAHGDASRSQLEAHRGRTPGRVVCHRQLPPYTATMTVLWAGFFLFHTMRGFGNRAVGGPAFGVVVVATMLGVLAWLWFSHRRSYLTIEPDGRMHWRDGRLSGEFRLNEVVRADLGKSIGAPDPDKGRAWWAAPESLRSDKVDFSELVLVDRAGRECELSPIHWSRWIPTCVLASALLDHLDAAGVPLDPVNRYNLEQAAGRIPPTGAVAYEP